MRFGTLILAMALLIPAIAIAKPEKSEKSEKPEKAEKAEKVVKEEKEDKEEKADKVKGKNEDEIKINTVLEVGFDINNRRGDKGYTRYNRIGYGKVELSARPVKKVRAEFGFEYKDGDSSLTIDKLYGQYNFADFGGVRVGYMKKSFGLEERAGVDERYFHKRSEINSEVEELGVLDHDLTFQYRHKLAESLRLVGGFSWRQDTTYAWRHRYHQNYSVEYETPKINLILAGIIGYYSRNDMIPWVTSLSFKYTSTLFVSESELTFGKNPLADTYLWGARLQEYFPIETGLKTLRQVIPIAEAALYSNDMDSEYFEAQLRAGLTLGFAKNSAFQWRNTYGARLRVIDGESELRRRRFDSEVVVIF